MSAESPAEYIERLRADKRSLQTENEVLKHCVKQLTTTVKELRIRLGVAPHDYEPAARPGLSDVD